MMKLKKFLSVPIFSVFLFVAFLYYVTVFIFIEDWMGVESSSGLFNALIFTLLASLSVFSFLVCVVADPGGVPSNYVPDVEDTIIDASDHELQKPFQGHLRRCDKCSAYKPPRAHHCRVCRRCVLRMDHHCVWINNCVGYRNYKAFVILVLYSSLASIYSAVMIVNCAVQKDWDFAGKVPLKIFYITCGLTSVGLSLTLGTFFCWHMYLIAHNMTTIEHYEEIRAAWLARKSGQTYHHPFNVGVYKNITLVLGPNMLKWLCPTAMSHIKDGINFPTARDGS